MDISQFRAKDESVRSGVEALLHLYEDEKRWTKFTTARNADGESVTVNAGVCWCLVGGCYLVSPSPRAVSALLDHLQNTIDPFCSGIMIVADLNDSAVSVAPVREFLHRALETA